jgi:hypothetical protein
VAKDAATSLTRTWTWTIDKTGSETEVTLLRGAPVDVIYTIEVDATYVDSAWAVAGSITVTNNHPTRVAEITGVADVVSPAIAASVDCGAVTFPYDIAANGGELTCSYSTGLPDAAGRTNTATATLQLYDFNSSGVGSKSGTDDYTGTASVNFTSPTITQIDEIITVTDDYGTPGVPGDDVVLGTANALTDTLPKTFTYTRTFAVDDFPFCGTWQIINTATFVTNYTFSSGSDSWTITFVIPCDEGCTPGFWQNLNNGALLWDNPVEDPIAAELTAFFGQPFYTDALFGDLFDVSDLPDGFGDKTLRQVVFEGAGSTFAEKAARDLVAALLNAADDEINYPGTIEQIKTDWESGNYEYFHATYGAYNELGCDRT